MANIKVDDLQPAGTELFTDSEGFMNELSSFDNTEVANIFGGNQHIYYGIIEEHDVSIYSSTSGHIHMMFN